MRPILILILAAPTLTSPAVASAAPERPDPSPVYGCPVALPDVLPGPDQELTLPISYCDEWMPLLFDGLDMAHMRGPR
jgi:hypothetical protein